MALNRSQVNGVLSRHRTHILEVDLASNVKLVGCNVRVAVSCGGSQIDNVVADANDLARIVGRVDHGTVLLHSDDTSGVNTDGKNRHLIAAHHDVTLNTIPSSTGCLDDNCLASRRVFQRRCSVSHFQSERLATRRQFAIRSKIKDKTPSQSLVIRILAGASISHCILDQEGHIPVEIQVDVVIVLVGLLITLAVHRNDQVFPVEIAIRSFTRQSSGRCLLQV